MGFFKKFFGMEAANQPGMDSDRSMETVETVKDEHQENKMESANELFPSEMGEKETEDTM